MEEQNPEVPEISLKDLNIIRIAAFLAIYAGVYDLFIMIAKCFNGRMALSLGFIAIFIGKGLLEWRSGWRTFALVYIWLCLIIIPITFIAQFWSPPETFFTLISFSLKESLPPQVSTILQVPIFIAVFVIWKTLSKENVKKRFEMQEEKSKDWFPVSFILAAFVSLIQVSHNYVIEGFLKELHHREATIYIYDEETNERLTPAIGHDYSSYHSIFPKVQTSARTDEKGHFYKIDWLSGEDITLKIVPQGYEEKTLTLSTDEYFKDYIVKLKKKNGSKPGKN